MSKAAKLSVLILAVLLIATFALAALTLLDKQKLENSKSSLEKQVADFQKREKTYIIENKELKEKLAKVEKDKNDLEQRIGSVDVDIGDLDEKIKALMAERDEWKLRVETIQSERDELLVKIEEQGEPEIVYKYIERDSDDEADDTDLDAGDTIKTSQRQPLSVDDDSYWAQMLKEKASLEIELESLKSSLSNNALEVGELKKANTDMQLELSALVDQKEYIEREIKHGNDLSDMLSLQLAKSKNDNKFLNDRISKLSNENVNLRDHIKKLTSTKIALEKSIIRVQEEKKAIEKKLIETENVIQGRIDEIWEIKKSIEDTVQPVSEATGSEIELPPIVVSANGPSAKADTDTDEIYSKIGGAFNGNIVSVNDENNFVIVDVGETSGLKLGDSLNIYRGADYVGALEIIQLRKDIAAADIKNKVAKIQVGDVVK